MDRRFESFPDLSDVARRVGTLPISVAAAHDYGVLTAIKMALDDDAVLPYLIGDGSKIEAMVDELGISRNRIVVIPASSDEESAYMAAELANDGVVRCIMKGMLNSSQFLQGVLHKDFELRMGRLLSHISIFEIPGFSRLLFLTDGGLNIHPDLAAKGFILENALQFLADLGIRSPKVALLSANEQVSEKMPVTMDAHELSRMAAVGRFGDAIVEGPMPLDLAISEEALIHKGIPSRISGKADLLFAPTIEVGNVLGKAITYFGNGTMAGLVLGAKVPLVLTSRADSYRAKLASIAFALLASSHLLVEEES